MWGARGCSPVQVTARALGDPSSSPRVAMPPHTPSAGSSPSKQSVLYLSVLFKPHQACNLSTPQFSQERKIRIFPYPLQQGGHPGVLPSQDWDAPGIPFLHHPPSCPLIPLSLHPQHPGGGGFSAPAPPCTQGCCPSPTSHPRFGLWRRRSRLWRVDEDRAVAWVTFFNRKALLTWSIFSIRVIIAVFFISADFHTAPSMCVKSHRANNKVFKIS